MSAAGEAISLRDLTALFREIEKAPTIPALWNLLVRHFQEQGFAAIAYVLFDRGRLNQSVAIFETGFAPEIVQTFAKLGYGKDAPAMRVAMTTGAPQLAEQVAQTQRLTAGERKHHEAMTAAGLGEALVLPLFGPLGRDAMGVLASPADPALFEEDRRPDLHIAAQAAHLRAFALRASGPVPTTGLSSRELEILRRVAQGKSNGEISEAFDIAPGTVDTYLRRIFDKLDVTDRTSAAVKGVGMGLIRA